MTCNQVLALMTALPLAECTPAQLEAAVRHASRCGACGPLVASWKALESRLTRLPEPAVPAGLEAAILERIARQGRLGVPPTGSDAVSAGIDRERYSLAATLAGLAVCLGVLVYRVAAGLGPIALAASGSGGPAIDGILALGLFIYVTGLILPLFGPGGVERSGVRRY